MAVTVIEFGAGRLAGAVYVPLAFTVPIAALPPEIPFTLQVTVGFVEFFTVTTKVCCSPNKTLAVVGVTATVMLEGGCDGPVPTAPQPTMDTTRRKSGRQDHTGGSELHCPSGFGVPFIAVRDCTQCANVVHAENCADLKSF